MYLFCNGYIISWLPPKQLQGDTCLSFQCLTCKVSLGSPKPKANFDVKTLNITEMSDEYDENVKQNVKHF